MNISKAKKLGVSSVVTVLVSQWFVLTPTHAVEEVVQSVKKVPISEVFSVKHLTKVTPERSKKYAKSQMTRWGWKKKKQFTCLKKLWTKESNWRHKAKNKSSGAYGIPQALPASKMKSAGKDYLTNPTTQIDWGMRYIKLRYETPCGAWSHFKKQHWY